MRKEAYVICDCCKQQFVNNNKVLRLYFRRYSSKEEGYGFHNICKKCEDKDRKEAISLRIEQQIVTLLDASLNLV